MFRTHGIVRSLVRLTYGAVINTFSIVLKLILEKLNLKRLTCGRAPVLVCTRICVCVVLILEFNKSFCLLPKQNMFVSVERVCIASFERLILHVIYVFTFILVINEYMSSNHEEKLRHLDFSVVPPSSSSLFLTN